MALHEVIKHTGAIHISNTLTRTQRMVSNILLKNAYRHLITKEIHTISISDLAKAIGFDSKNIDVLKQALAVLNRTQLEWNILRKDKVHEWGVSTILADAKVIKGKGICEYSYSPAMREIFSNPNIYARLNLLVQKEFTNKHGLALWEFLIEFLCSNKFKEGYTEWLKVEDFKKLLGVQKDSLYKKFKYVNQNLLKEPLKEINKVSDINAEVEYRRESRCVAAIRFHVSRKTAYQMPLDLVLPPAIVDDDKIDFDRQIVEIEKVKNKALLDRLLSFGITEKQAKDSLSAHSEAYINENLDIVEKSCRAGNVKNVPAYAMTALNEDFRKRNTFLDKEKESKKAEAKARADRLEQQETIKNLKSDFDGERLENALNYLSKREKNRIEKEFLEAIKKEKGGNFVLGFYKRNGFEHIVVKGAFHNFAREKLAKEPFPMAEFKVFIKSRGYKISKFKGELKALMLNN